MCIDHPIAGHSGIMRIVAADKEFDSFSDCSEANHQVHMLLSRDAVALGGNSKNLKFLGCIPGHEVILLVDSASSNSFINDKLAPVLLGFRACFSLSKCRLSMVRYCTILMNSNK
jgi:hypothetical protein